MKEYIPWAGVGKRAFDHPGRILNRWVAQCSERWLSLLQGHTLRSRRPARGFQFRNGRSLTRLPYL